MALCVLMKSTRPARESTARMASSGVVTINRNWAPSFGPSRRGPETKIFGPRRRPALTSSRQRVSCSRSPPQSRTTTTPASARRSSAPAELRERWTCASASRTDDGTACGRSVAIIASSPHAAVRIIITLCYWHAATRVEPGRDAPARVAVSSIGVSPSQHQI